MKLIYARIRKEALQIVSRYPSPDFYKDHFSSNELSRHYFETNPFTIQLRAFVARQLEDDFGHGLEHALKVAMDAGALMIIENKLTGSSNDVINRRVILVQCAALLHDIKRKQENHAVKGAAYARKVLKEYPFDPDEIEDICRAIQNHEAFKNNVKSETLQGSLISDCLYDADKFRWGPDNFRDTVWKMVTFFKIPVVKFMELYPDGMEKIAKVKHTFRTGTGKKYGPQFIDIGLAIGEELFDFINIEFADLL
jgi:hypothetical protein